MAFSLDIKNEAEANAWRQRANTLNEQAKQAVDEAMELLKTMPDVATGNFFNEVVSLGNQICEGMVQIMDGMQKLCDVISSVVEAVKNKVGDLLGDAVNVARSIMG